MASIDRFIPPDNLSMYLLVDVLLFCYMTNTFLFFFVISSCDVNTALKSVHSTRTELN